MNFYYNFEYLQDRTTFFAVRKENFFHLHNPIHLSLPPLSPLFTELR